MYPVYVPCIYRMPGGVIVGDSGLSVVVCLFNVCQLFKRNYFPLFVGSFCLYSWQLSELTAGLHITTNNQTIITCCTKALITTDQGHGSMITCQSDLFTCPLGFVNLLSLFAHLLQAYYFFSLAANFIQFEDSAHFKRSMGEKKPQPSWLKKRTGGLPRSVLPLTVVSFGTCWEIRSHQNSTNCSKVHTKTVQIAPKLKILLHFERGMGKNPTTQLV